MADIPLPASTVRSTVRRTSGVNAAAGLWLFISPFLLGYSDVVAALWNDVVVGLLILVLAMTRTIRPLHTPAASWLNVLLGVWLLCAPIVLGYGTRETAADPTIATWNDVIVGIVVTLLAIRSAQAVRRITAVNQP